MKSTAFKILCLVLLVSVLLCSCEGKTEYCEIGIVLPDGYEELDSESSFDRVYANGTDAVGIFRVSFEAAIDDGVPTTLSAKKFAEYYLEQSGLVTEVEERDNIPYFVYVEEQDGQRYMHVPTFYRTPYAYFIITFTSAGGGDEEKLGEFLEIASTVYLINV